MPGIQFITTKAGRAALVNAEHSGATPVTVLEIGLTAAVFTANENMTTLPGEIKRLKSISGAVVAPDTVHVTIRDDSRDVYTVRGIGYWLSNGVLLGVYSQRTPIMEKSAQAMVLLAADVIFTTLKATSLTFGAANFINPPATTSRQGVVELATGNETAAGSDAVRAVTPAGLVPALTKAIAEHVAKVDPHTQYLTQDRANALYFRKLPAYVSSSTDCDTLLDTGIRNVSVADDRGILAGTHLPAGAYAYGTLTTVNGGLFVKQIYTEEGPPQRTWERSGQVGRAKSPFDGRPWNLVWQSGNFDPRTKQDKLNFIPVQQGTGIGQKQHIIKIGWSGSALKATVDALDAGDFVFQSKLDSTVAQYLPRAGGEVTGLLRATGATGGVSAAGADSKPAIEVSSHGRADEAYMRFIRPSSYAIHLGLDANNNLSVGGYSMGNVSYKLWHAGNFNPAAKQDALGYQPTQAVGGRRNSVVVNDSRATVYTPKDRDQGVYFDFVNNKANGLTDGGTHHGAITFRQYGAGTDFSGGLAHQLCFTDNDNIWHRSGKDAVWQGWRKLWHSGNFDPATKQNALGFVPVQQGGGVGQLTNLVRIGWSNGKGLKVTVDATDQGTVVFGDRPIRLNWNGLAGQPPWLLGGASPDAVNLYNPSNFRVAYAATAGGATAAEKIANGKSYMQFQWSDPGGQPTYLWGSDGPTAARLAVIGNLNVGHAREADNAAKWCGHPLRFQENPGKTPLYVLGITGGANDVSLYNASRFADRGAQVVHASGIQEFGPIDPGHNGGVADLPSPWVVTGLRTNESGNYLIYLRGTWLKNN